MPQNKRLLFEPKRRDTALKAQALCHPARLEIIWLLQKHDFLLCSELVDLIPLGQGTVSHHLEFLLKTEIVVRDVQFDAVGYCLDQKGWELAKALIKRFFAEISQI